MMNPTSIVGWLKKTVAKEAHLCLDSRGISPGDVFFACPGNHVDGRQFIQAAINGGAAAVIMEPGDDQTVMNFGVPVLQVQDLVGQLGAIGHEWYGRPSESMTVIAVTGTNGKTSSVQWLAQALTHQGTACGTVGTLGTILPDGTSLGGVLTTPDALTMHRNLAALREAGAQAVAIEASSIGLHQGRLNGLAIDIAAFTNLSRDHLDYHGSVDDYAAAKAALFRWPGLRAAVINADDGVGRQLAARYEGPGLLTYSIDGQACLRALDLHLGARGMVFTLTMGHGAAQIVTRILGAHNVSNLLLVAGVLCRMGWSVSRIASALTELTPVVGRLQVAEPVTGCGDSAMPLPLVVVDYAHTPDALDHALSTLSATAQERGGRLVCVFGCGGNRDRGKRPLMGKVALERADAVILTSDNPRDEDPSTIINDIAAAGPGRFRIQAERARAILDAIWSADARDVILLAGKGHETYQEVRGVRKHFDDLDWARFALSWARGVEMCTDSRRLSQGQMFLALEGESFDGHNYLEQVAAKGACAAVVSHPVPASELPQFVLGDTRAALTIIGTAWRERFSLPVIAVTGSNGKTTTKEMIASILRAWHGPDSVLWTTGNLNNDLGVPLTVLRLSGAHKAAVVELGMNHPGEIAELARVARPTVALVNNAQREHQEFMHTVEAVAHENGSVIAALPSDGVAVFPADDAYSHLWSQMAGVRRTCLFALDRRADVFASQIHYGAQGTSFLLHSPDGDAQIELGAPGKHNLRNALAAAACALSCGAPLEAVVQGLERFAPVAGRMQPIALPGGRQLIDDTYNANPDSVRAAIDVLASLSGSTALVLGDMAEVGSDGVAVHGEVGAYAKAQGISHLLTFGPAARHAAQAYGSDAHSFDDVEELVAHLAGLGPVNILVKGSRSTRMERVVQGYLKQLALHVQGDGHVA